MHRYATVVLVVVLVAGCGGGGSGGPVHLSATPATIGDTTLDETGFEPAGESTGWVNTTVSVSLSGDVELEASKDVRARSPVRAYSRETDGPPAIAGLVTVPAVRLLEKSANIARNPAGDLGPTGYAGRLPSTYSNLEVAEVRSNTSVSLLGNRTFLQQYAASASHNGSTVDVRVFVATVRHRGDFVTFVAIVPAEAADPNRVMQLLGGVRH